MWLIVTLITYVTAVKICKRFGHPLLNPLLLGVSFVIAVLLVLDVPYSEYYEDNLILSYLLQPAIVVMAYPIFCQLSIIKKKALLILGSCFLGALFSMLSGGIIALSLGADVSLVVSVLTKSVTVPIAMATTNRLDGDVAVSAILVLFAGLVGAMAAYPIFHFLKIKGKIARGLTIGAAAHALGTAQALDKSPEDAAYSSLALALCGIFTAICAPVVMVLIVMIYQGG
ncbi:LrgB family protein [Vibrio sp. T11.5]|uniref:LrgB family protein n=1 Tax=Vibrio sp. T11.5 TaxID=2998836 RepID=UPI0022CD4F48|nr:LrgB family protein [Vibrio sp. T11.5]MDA0117949.1 LrgB family protein [Vibrio sp. T11.5]